MQRELNPQQAREIAHLRSRHPRAEVRVYQKPWGIIVEAYDAGHAVELKGFDWSGGVTPDSQIAIAA